VSDEAQGLVITRPTERTLLVGPEVDRERWRRRGGGLSPDDARVAFAVLTEAGRHLVAEAAPTARRLSALLFTGTAPRRSSPR
jgi:hypothetical protein